ncbi:hypothetical protein ACFFX0_27000 [Citricoccus parietis]|uniref:Uncharacterized protein n=1 Tax=Citricoccus parietis TaxID=592307 RepID=A0ABV5G6S4_9MICC
MWGNVRRQIVLHRVSAVSSRNRAYLALAGEVSRPRPVSGARPHVHFVPQNGPPGGRIGPRGQRVLALTQESQPGIHGQVHVQVQSKLPLLERLLVGGH